MLSSHHCSFWVSLGENTWLSLLGFGFWWRRCLPIMLHCVGGWWQQVFIYWMKKQRKWQKVVILVVLRTSAITISCEYPRLHVLYCCKYTRWRCCTKHRTRQSPGFNDELQIYDTVRYNSADTLPQLCSKLPEMPWHPDLTISEDGNYCLYWCCCNSANWYLKQNLQTLNPLNWYLKMKMKEISKPGMVCSVCIHVAWSRA